MLNNVKLLNMFIEQHLNVNYQAFIKSSLIKHIKCAS